MYIEDTTAHERFMIECAVDALFVDLEANSKILSLLHDAYFGNYPRRELSAGEADTVATILHAVVDNISTITLKYELTIAKNTPSVATHMDSMRKVKVALKTQRLCDKTTRLNSDCLEARRKELLSMPDEQAAAGLEALLEEISE